MLSLELRLVTTNSVTINISPHCFISNLAIKIFVISIIPAKFQHHMAHSISVAINTTTTTSCSMKPLSYLQLSHFPKEPTKASHITIKFNPMIIFWCSKFFDHCQKPLSLPLPLILSSSNTIALVIDVPICKSHHFHFHFHFHHYCHYAFHLLILRQ